MTLKKPGTIDVYFVEASLPWIALLALLCFSYVFFVVNPYLGFQYSSNSISFAIPIIDLQPGDEILRVEDVTPEMVDQDLTTWFFEGARAGDQVEIVVERNGESISFNHTIPGVTLEEFLGRLTSQWFVPYIFWLAGTAALLFLRPRSTLRLLLALFCYLTAVWLSPSTMSGTQFMSMALMLRAGIWLSVPVYLHLHWQFPTPLRRLPGWIWVALYLACAGLAVASWLQLLPQSSYFIGFLVMVAGSLALLSAHLIWQPAERRLLRWLVVSVGIVLLPGLVVAVIGALNIPFTAEGIVVLGLAALPGFYFFTLYQHQLTSTQATRANRLLWVYVLSILISLLLSIVTAVLFGGPSGQDYRISLGLVSILSLALITFVSFIPFLTLPALADERITLAGGDRLGFSANRAAAVVFFILGLTLFEILLVLALQRWLVIPGAAVGIALLAALSAAVLTLVGYQPFRRFFDRKVLGISMIPETILATYSERVATSLERSALGRLLLEEIMPSLLVRQFAMMQAEGSSLRPLFSLRVDSEMLPAEGAVQALAAASGKRLQRMDTEVDTLIPAWVRLVLPMRVANAIEGYWLLGQRDPDNAYSEADIEQLKTLAQQTALALVNIEQAEDLRALYFDDIDRRETERVHMAAELHDNVLNELAVLSSSLDESTPDAAAAYQKVTLRIREVINDLRPSNLQYGLSIGLETLVDDLSDRRTNGPRIEIEIPDSACRYNEKVELYLYRIVQQACENALQHAECEVIRVSGLLGEHSIELQISDDGKGFPAGEAIHLPDLLAQKHFGLAGMFERAALIDAVLQIQSQPGQGCQVRVEWKN
jgi:signal transduction histidine kinase